MKKRLLSTTCLALVLTALSVPVHADTCERDDDKRFCHAPEQVGKQGLTSVVTVKTAIETSGNLEYRDTSRKASKDLIAYKECGIKPYATTSAPFKISIDGKPQGVGQSGNSADLARCHDLALEAADIQIRYDALSAEPALNVTAYPSVAVVGETVKFTPYSNYHAFIKKAELRLFEASDTTQGQPLEVIAFDPQLDQPIEWSVPKGQRLDDLVYLIRVYDRKGRFDETAPAQLRIADHRRPIHKGEGRTRETLIGYGENNRHISNIPVSGGTVTINGESLEPGSQVKIDGVAVPVDRNGLFAYRQIVKSGKHDYTVVTTAPNGQVQEYRRRADIPKSDWFYTGIADLTVGQNDVSGPIADVTGNDTNRTDGDFFVEGRLGFYAKGKLQSGWELTASADTRENDIEDIFSDFTDRDPESILRRIDPDDTAFAVYGDDSTAIQDAPTQGRFFLRAQKDESQVLWGDFQTRITGTDLVDFRRTLYGANAEYVSNNQTRFGEDKTVANAFAADPGSVASVDEFRGTGGSLYFLQGQDVIVGSERIRIEERDRDSGVVVNVRNLVFGQDYDINYIQGRVTLSSPLSSTGSQSTLVQAGSSTLSGNPLFLVVNYEFASSATDISNFTTGGRVSHWINDHVQVGVTAFNQNAADTQDQELLGGDLTFRYAPGTYFKFESARSLGPGNGETTSTNGGFNFAEIDQTRTENIEAFANRAELSLDLGEITNDKRQGDINIFTLYREDGFSAPGELTSEDTFQVGLSADLPFNNGRSSFNTKGDFLSGDDTGEVTSLEIGGMHKITDEHDLSLAVRHDDRNIGSGVGGNSAILSEEGERTDLALRLHYLPLTEGGDKKNYDVYALGQVTLSADSNRENNNRAGLGGRYDINDRLSLNGEATGGSTGFGSNIGLDYQASDRTNYYVNYLIDSERTDIGGRSRNTSLTFGGRSRYKDSVSVFAEERYETFDNNGSGLIHSFGLDVAATDAWTFGGSFENGEIADSTTGDIERTAISVNANYASEDVRYGNAVELRLEDFGAEPSRTTWLVRNNLSYQTTPDWRFLGEFDFALSESGLDGTLDADFFEVTAAYAYRPVDNDRLNWLFSYEYLQDEATPGQFGGTGDTSASDFEQRTHVLSTDFIYDVVPKLSLGGSLGYRFGQIRDNSVANSDFFDSQAYLVIGRADWHVVKHWDVLGEIRHLDVREADDSRTGALVAAYRHVNQNLRVGLGYNFTDFSDDLTDLSFDSQGLFFNVTGKF